MFISELLSLICRYPEGEGGSGPGGQTDDSSGDDGNQDDNQDGDDDFDDAGGDANVPRGTYSKVVREARNLRQRLRALEDEKKQREAAEMKKKGDLEGLLAQKDEEIAQLSGKLSSFETAILEGRKESALRKALGKSLDPKWDRLLSSFVGQVQLDKEGKVDAKSVKKLADDFTKEYPEAFNAARTPPSNPPGGTGGEGSITLEQWKAMPNGPEKRAAMARVVD